MKQTCENCKWEPDWKEEFDGCGWFYGKCNKVPSFFQEGSLRLDNGSVDYEASCQRFKDVDGCTLWEAK